VGVKTKNERREGIYSSTCAAILAVESSKRRGKSLAFARTKDLPDQSDGAQLGFAAVTGAAKFLKGSRLAICASEFVATILKRNSNAASDQCKAE